MLIFAGCSSAGQEPDSGVADALDGDGDARPDSGSADIDLDGNFGVSVPGQAQACSLGLGRNLTDQLHLKARIHFRPGLILLPREADDFEADLIEQVELTPGQGNPVADGPGRFTREGVIYSFSQALRAGDRRLSVILRLPFEVEPLRVLDSGGMLMLLGGEEGWLRLVFDDGQELNIFHACAPGAARSNQYQIGFADGSSLRLSEWMIEVPGWFMFCAAGMTSVSWNERVVDDFFQLAYQPGNHNILENFAVRFDPPAGDLHGLVVYTQSLGVPLNELTQVFELNQDLTVGEEMPPSSVTYLGTACNMP